MSARNFRYDPNIDALLKIVLPDYLVSEKLKLLRDFLNSDEVYSVIKERNMDLHSYTTAGSFLKSLIEISLTLPKIQQKAELYNAIKFFLYRIKDVGPPPYEIKQVKLYFPDIFQAFDLETLNSDADAVSAMKTLIEYLVRDFKLQRDLQGFQLNQYDTRGTFLAAFLNTIQSRDYIPEELKVKIPALIRHVTTSGLGSAPVDYVPTNMISAIKSG
jgi:hypothetical protein